MALLLAGSAALAQATVTYGTITGVNLVNDRSRSAQTRGAILGGVLGAVATSSASVAGQAVGTAGGAIAGQRLGRLTGNRQAFEYTIRIGDQQTVRVVTDEAGLRIGDCIAVERGNFNNLRLVDDGRCAPNVRPLPDDVTRAVSCMRAKDQLLAANTDSDFDRAERRVRLLCFD
jgi:outer membrane lipoprotein SlyB